MALAGLSALIALGCAQPQPMALPPATASTPSPTSSPGLSPGVALRSPLIADVSDEWGAPIGQREAYTVVVGQALQLVATTPDNAPVTWETYLHGNMNPARATVDAAGHVTITRPGLVLVRARPAGATRQEQFAGITLAALDPTVAGRPIPLPAGARAAIPMQRWDPAKEGPYVITRQADLNAFWQATVRDRAGTVVGQAPPVDFTRESVVFFLLTQAPEDRPPVLVTITQSDAMSLPTPTMVVVVPSGDVGNPTPANQGPRIEHRLSLFAVPAGTQRLTLLGARFGLNTQLRPYDLATPIAPIQELITPALPVL
jgi:hypothetical protein